MSLAILKRWLLGVPLATRQQRHQRLPNFLALPVFASDALSSNAYATEEIMLTLMAVGSMGFKFTLPIALAIGGLLIVVATSYRQTIFAYPGGASAYLVVTDNLGVRAGLVAAAALLLDYVLTVSVSVAAGVLAITSMFDASTEMGRFANEHRVWLCVFFVLFVTLMNLRGVKESGALFAGPTYAFIVTFLIMIVVGLVKYFTGDAKPLPVLNQVPPDELQSLGGVAGVFLILRAFASGCAALTGVEAISDGIPAFKPPESQNAAKTLVAMAVILMTIFLGLTALAFLYHAQPLIKGWSHGHPTEVTESLASVLASHIFGKGPFYYVLQVATASILILAANTSYADFPRVGSLLARSSMAPRQLANLGDRLVFQNGILLLAVSSSLLLVAFQGQVNKLIPLYAVGVFLSFTLSQSGMVKRWMTRREPGWQKGALINAIGATSTGLVLLIIASVKFKHGAWIVILLIPVLVLMFLAINRHYRHVADQLALEGYSPPRHVRHRVLLLIPGVNRGVLTALQYAQALSNDLEAVYVEFDPARTPIVQQAWQQWGEGTRLRVLKSPWRSLTEPISKYIETIVIEDRLDFVTVVIPEFVTTHWWHKLLHNSTGLMLKFALLFERNVVVTNVRYYLGTSQGPPPSRP